VRLFQIVTDLGEARWTPIRLDQRANDRDHISVRSGRHFDKLGANGFDLRM
jgi:hypothetical protein